MEFICKRQETKTSPTTSCSSATQESVQWILNLMCEDRKVAERQRKQLESILVCRETIYKVFSVCMTSKNWFATQFLSHGIVYHKSFHLFITKYRCNVNKTWLGFTNRKTPSVSFISHCILREKGLFWLMAWWDPVHHGKEGMMVRV